MQYDKMKHNKMLSTDLKAAVKETIGTCVSVGLTVNEEEPKKIIADINSGVFDKFFSLDDLSLFIWAGCISYLKSTGIDVYVNGREILTCKMHVCNVIYWKLHIAVNKNYWTIR